jgi:hypothetical protein
MSTGDLSIFCRLAHSLSSEVYSSPCRGNSHSLFILRYLTFFEAIVNGIVFIYSFSICSLLVYRKANEFCKLILCPAILLKLFILSSNFG